MDFFWSDIETKKGVYNFTEYDILMQHLDQYGMKAIFILDYTNSLYDNNLR